MHDMISITYCLYRGELIDLKIENQNSVKDVADTFYQDKTNIWSLEGAADCN